MLTCSLSTVHTVLYRFASLTVYGLQCLKRRDSGLTVVFRLAHVENTCEPPKGTTIQFSVAGLRTRIVTAAWPGTHITERPFLANCCKACAHDKWTRSRRHKCADVTYTANLSRHHCVRMIKTCHTGSLGI